MNFKKIHIEFKDKQAIIWLNQPEIRNSLNPLMINDLIKCIKWIERNDDIMVLIIRGRGKSFCAGADINWMKDSGSSGYRKNYLESKKLASFFNTIYQTNKVVINLIHGHAFGGALGFIGAGDFTFATKETLFGLPELKMGLAPSVIAPYLLTRIKQNVLKFKIYTGDTFTSEEALNIGLIDGIYSNINDMEIKSGELINSIISVSPLALKESKKLMKKLNAEIINKKKINKTIKTITNLKMSSDAKDRMLKFIVLNK
jgi:methylglutaconyl-CoA hydratase